MAQFHLFCQYVLKADILIRISIVYVAALITICIWYENILYHESLVLLAFLTLSNSLFSLFLLFQNNSVTVVLWNIVINNSLWKCKSLLLQKHFVTFHLLCFLLFSLCLKIHHLFKFLKAEILINYSLSHPYGAHSQNSSFSPSVSWFLSLSVTIFLWNKLSAPQCGSLTVSDMVFDLIFQLRAWQSRWGLP